MKAEAIDQSMELEAEFKALAEEWHRSTGMYSLMHKKAMHPAYQRIIGMGEKALPLIFRELQQRRGHWLWALKAITGEDPVRPNDSFSEAVDTWLSWGRTHGYL